MNVPKKPTRLSRRDYLLVRDGKMTEVASLEDTPPGQPAIHARIDKQNPRRGLWMEIRLVEEEEAPSRKPVK